MIKWSSSLAIRSAVNGFAKIFIRKYAPRKLPSAYNNPGLNRRMKMFEEEGIEEGFNEDMEADFLNVHLTHKEVVQEARAHQEKLGYWIVKNKYFKSHTINLLTYSEKEQIRHLHESDAMEWTTEKLAQSFPATEETIRKIVKAKWQVRDSRRVELHDKKVQRNWEDLKADKVPDMDPELRKHLLKFADRQIGQMPTEEINRERLKLPLGEFSNIITSCKKAEEIKIEVPQLEQTRTINQPALAKQPPPPLEQYGSDTYLVDRIDDRRPMTIELFRTASGMVQKNPSSSDASAVSTPADPAYTALGSRTAKVQMSPVPSQFKGDKSQMIQFQEQITIPRKLQRRGATYKIDDSYYDDDGEFLYRVPGMVK